ncbi:hypothetical protein QJS10_CPB11g00861 [Acorus calamus]|uniref:Uncharacterized protein n=1 Tax=Acorus calamus TaxID=4465 RepID=A0AAV9DUK3_ACOCL|nr:hypothetical protein QJS10_CPB11g00861 [Acorus calamus]
MKSAVKCFEVHWSDGCEEYSHLPPKRTPKVTKSPSPKRRRTLADPPVRPVDHISELGRRFQELSHGLIQVASKGAETPHSTDLLKRRTIEIMKEVEEDLRKSSQNCQDDNVQDEVDSISNVEAAKGFKRRGKKTVGGKPQKRWIGVLEKSSRGQSSQTQRASHNSIEIPQPFAPMVGNYDSSQGMTSMTQLLQVLDGV